MNDLSKWLATDLGIPYAVLATAASMNGYSAANVAPTIAGLKSLFRAHAPLCIAAIPLIIQTAPYELTASGLGDVIAKPVSTADWILNNVLFGEQYSPAIAAIIDSIEPGYTLHSAALAARAPDATKALFDALVFSGCAMTLQGSSLPASGGEHLISHTLDMMAHIDHTRHDLHGRQVGVATIFAAALYERFFELEERSFRMPRLQFNADDWAEIAPAIQSELEKKRERLHEACRRLCDKALVRELLLRLRPQLRSPQSIKACLQQAGAAHRLADIGCSRERFLTAVFRAPTIRGRFTSLDLALISGILESHAEKIVDSYLL
jgi:glycerol-1-phosphate dehydrogenase [NAD(P)+]